MVMLDGTPDMGMDPELDPELELGLELQLEPQTESDSESEMDDIPSLDDIIPWQAKETKPRQPEVFDAVRTDEGINVTFVENVLKSYFTKDDDSREVKLLNQTQQPMEIANDSQRNNLTEVNAECTVDDEKEICHLIIKTLTASQPARALSAAHSFDRREVGFYTQILDDLYTFQRQEERNPQRHIHVPTAECYFARYTVPGAEVDLDGDHKIPPDESVVVLENVKHRGFEHPIMDVGLSKKQVLTAFEGIARFHSLSLAMKERSGIPLHRSYPYMLCQSEANECVVRLFEKNIPEIVDLLTTMGAKELGVKLSALKPRVEDLVDALARPEEPVSVLSHMNLWTHNVLFKGEDECVFIDWQMITCARPTFDLAFLLASSVNSSLRRVHAQEFLTHYYSKFTEYALRFGLDIEGNLGYTTEHLRQDFAYSQLLVLFFWIAKSRDLIVSRETEMQFLDYVSDLEARNLLNPDVIDIDNLEYVYWIPRNPRTNMVFRIERRRSSSDDNDHACGLFPVNELPEE